MKFYLAMGATVLCMIMLFYMMANSIGGGWARLAPNFERVRILDRVLNENGSETVTVQLSPKIEAAVALGKEDQLHADAQYVCVGIFGDPETTTAKATFAELSNCPLPTSRTMPLTGTTRNLTGSGKKTFRAVGGGANTGSPAGQLSKSGVGFSKSP